MSLDGKLLARAKARLDDARKYRERDMEERRARAYAADGRIEAVDARMSRTVMDAMAAALRRGADPKEALDDLRDENLGLQEERALLLTRAGFPADYLTESYACPRCRDTGYRDTGLCDCLMDLYRDEQRKDLSALLNLGEETFESFDLSYYSPVPDDLTGISPRQTMEVIFETCRQYARRFNADSLNLYLSGGTGLGKTFLSTCIAKEVSERGFSVVYDTAASVFSKYEQDKFSRDSADTSAARADIRRLEGCDLLILDDLGTEMLTSFVTSALYTLINNRLLNRKKTIISSNLPVEALGSRYSAPIMSRVAGEFVVLNFQGRDIRLIKNGL